MSNVPRKGLVDHRFTGLTRPKKTIRRLARVGLQDQNAAGSYRGRQNGGGYPIRTS